MTQHGVSTQKEEKKAKKSKKKAKKEKEKREKKEKKREKKEKKAKKHKEAGKKHERGDSSEDEAKVARFHPAPLVLSCLCRRRVLLRTTENPPRQPGSA